MKICPKCKTQLREGAKYCSMCGFKLVKSKGLFMQWLTTHPFLGSFLFLFICMFVIGSIAVYMHVSPGKIDSEIFSNSISLNGNGASEFKIPVTISNKLGIYMSGIEVEGIASDGTIEKCITNEKGTCKLNYIPPKTSEEKMINITIKVSGMEKILEIEINADLVDEIQMELGKSEIFADGVSSTSVIATVLNELGEEIADGTEITFKTNPLNSGSFSENPCKTENGVCIIDYISSVNPGEVTITANSGNKIASQDILLKILPPSKVVLSLKNDSLVGNGESTTLVTAYLENSAGNPVGNYLIEFEVSAGSINSNCTTGSDGKCYATYKVPYLEGQAVISAFSGDVSGSVSIELIGFSNLVVHLQMSDYVGDPIVPAFAMNNEYLGEDMITVQIFNEGTKTFNGKVKVSIPEWSSEQTSQVYILSADVEFVYFNPPLMDKVFNNLQTQNAQYMITIEDNEGNSIFEHSVPVDIMPYNSMVWYTPYYGPNADYHNNIIVSWVTPESTEIHSLLSDAASNTPTNSILGYQTYPSGCNGPCDQSESTSIQMEAIYEELQDQGMHYVNAPGNYFSSSQTVYTPAESLDVGGANCIDGALVFASAIVSAGMHAYLMIVPGHAFVCVRASPSSEFISCVETTMLGTNSYDNAVEEGNSEFNYYYNTDEINVIDVNVILADGVKSIPS